MAKKSTIDLTAFKRTPQEKKFEEISVAQLFLDPHNPRLAENPNSGTQAAIQKIMEKEFDLEPISDSLYKNGFFWEEPLLAVKEAIAEKGKTPVYVVIEGNRRLAALKHIQGNPTLFSDSKARKRLEQVPVIVRSNRQETLSFVGFRHITGVKGWESAAMAQYALSVVKGGNTIAEVAQAIGDKTKKIERLIRTQSIIEKAQELELTPEDASKKFYFSYLLTATDAIATKEWLGLATDKKKGTVTKINTKNLKLLWSWLYGSKKQQSTSVLSESRQLSKLSLVIANKSAVTELEKTRNLERAFSQTKSREEYVADVLSEVRNQLQDLYSSVYIDGKLSNSKDSAKFLKSSREDIRKVKTTIEKIENELL